MARDPRFAEVMAPFAGGDAPLSDEQYLEASIRVLEYVSKAYPLDSNLHLQVLHDTWGIVNYLDLEGRYEAFMRQRYVETLPHATARFGPDHDLVREVRRRRDEYLQIAGLIEAMPPGHYDHVVAPAVSPDLPQSPLVRIDPAEAKAIEADPDYAALFAAYRKQRSQWVSDAAWLAAAIDLLRYVGEAYPRDSDLHLRTLERATFAAREVDYGNEHAALLRRLHGETLPLAEVRLGADHEMVGNLRARFETLGKDAERLAEMAGQEDVAPTDDWRLDAYEEPARSELAVLFEQRAKLSGDALVANLVVSREIEISELGGFLPYPLYFTTRDMLDAMTRAGQFEDAARVAREWLGAMPADELGQSDMIVTVSAYLAHAQFALGDSEGAVQTLAPLLLDPDLNAVPPEQLYPWGPGSDPVEAESYLPQARSQLAHMLLLADAQTGLALDSARFAIRYLRGVRDNRPPGAEADALIAEEFAAPDRPFGQDARQQFSNFVEAAWRVRESGGDASGDLFAQAFTAAQDAVQDRTTLALARNAARDLAARAGFADLAREREELSDEITAMARAGNTGRDYRLALTRQQDLDLRMQQAAPEFFRLIRPRGLPLEEARALLSPGEALLLVLPTEFGTHVLAVTPEGEAWHKSPLTAAELAKQAQMLRADLDPWGAGVIRFWDGGFPANIAYDIYRELVVPLMPSLADTHALLYATGPALSSIPLTVLTMEAPEDPEARDHDYRAMPWLGDRFAMAQLPSLSSLAFLRGDKSAAAGQRAMVGFGDPVLEGEAATRGGRNAGLIGSRRVATTATGREEAPALANLESLRSLSRLPGTAEEVRMLAQTFSTAEGAVYLGAAATETAVKQEDLSDARYLVFATHGLTAGEGDISSEPGLVLTPPAEATPADDGLLSASEILGLDLSADWVILSACNTAAADGLGGGGLSGLARSFFYAGARSLLASHWPVRDDIAPLLTTRSVRQLERDTQLSRAEALRRAMIEVRNDESIEFGDHPSTWAPFITVGDLR